ncbi:MAG: hypothetical protein RR086_05985 [Clostridia bacterium]
MADYTVLLEKMLLKKAKGYTVKEKTEEYSLIDGVPELTKRKVSTKHIASDVSAVKALLQLSQLTDNAQNIYEMTDEQLKIEKLRLLNLLKVCDGVCQKENMEENDDN